MSNIIAARFSLDGFSLNLMPRAHQDQQTGRATLTPSGFTPRIGIYTGSLASPEYRGEKAFQFQDIPTEAIDGVHKGLKSKDELFASPEMQSVLEAWVATAAGVLDDTPDGANSVGSGQLDYRMETIESSLAFHSLIENYVMIEFGVYESATSRSKVSSVIVKYVPDDLVETNRAASRNLKKQLEDAKTEIRKSAIAIAKLNPASLDYDVQHQALIVRIQQSEQSIRSQQQQLMTRYNILYFPLSKLFEEPTVKAAIGTMVAGVFSELKKSTYLLESYDLSTLAAMDLDATLHLFAHMQPA